MAMRPASLMRTLFASTGKFTVNASRSDLAEGQQRDRATRPDGEPANHPGPEGRGFLEGGRRLEQSKGNLRAGGATPHDLDHPSPHDEQRCAGPAFLANVLAIGVVTLVEDAGEAPEIPATEVLEQGDLPQEFHEARAAFCHGAFRR